MLKNETSFIQHPLRYLPTGQAGFVLQHNKPNWDTTIIYLL